MDEPDDIVARAVDLEQRIDDHGPAIDDLLAYAQKSRRMTTVALALSVAVSLLGAGLTLVVVKVRDASVQLARSDDVAAALAANLVERCETINANRAGEAELWNVILNASTTPPQTETQRKRVAAIAAIVERIYAPSDCLQLLADPPEETTP